MPTARHSGGWGAENVGDPRIRHVLCELLRGCRKELGDTSWRTWAGGQAEPRDRSGGWGLGVGERASPWGLGRARRLGTFPGPPRKPSTQQAFNNRTSGNRTHTSSRVDRGPFVLPAESSCPPHPLHNCWPTSPRRNRLGTAGLREEMLKFPCSCRKHDSHSSWVLSVSSFSFASN